MEIKGTVVEIRERGRKDINRAKLRDRDKQKKTRGRNKQRDTREADK